MRNFRICFDRMAPDGHWYFIRPFSLDGSNKTRRRICPNSKTFDPFLAAFTKAVLNMPKLEYFELSADFSDVEPAKSYIKCYVEETFDLRGVFVPSTIHFKYEGKSTWVPPSDTMEILRTLGRDRFGGPLIEEYSGDYPDGYTGPTHDDTDASMDDAGRSTDESTDGSEGE